MGYIYKIINLINLKIYIGQTVQPVKRRWRQHELSAQNTKRSDSNLPLHSAMRKYGIDAFKYEIIEKCRDTDINDREVYWISFYDSTNPEKGYNVSLGGGGTSYYKMDEVLSLWKQGMSVKDISKTLDADRGFLALRLKETGITAEEINLRRYASVKETRGNIVYQYSLDGNYLRMYVSVQEARKETNIGHIERCCNGQQKQAGGFIWSYEKQDTIDAVKNDHPATKKCKVYQYNLEGYKVNEYESAYHAEKETGINQTSIRNVCTGRRSTAGGYAWSYENKPFLEILLSKNTGKAKRVAKYSLKTGDLIQVYDSLSNAAKENNIASVSNITLACKGKYRSCGGFIWKFVD